MKLLQRLINGNKRFLKKRQKNIIFSHNALQSIVKDQKPFVAILSCSDSRVPLEIIFDQGFGKIFVIRNAGNITDKATIGSIEFAVKVLKIKLLVVMGHEFCGAVSEAVNQDSQIKSDSINYIKQSITKAVHQAKKHSIHIDELKHNATIFNIHNTIKKLKHSLIIKEYLANKKLIIKSAFYKLTTGKVDFNI